MEKFIERIIQRTKFELLNGIEQKYHEELLKGYIKSIHIQFRGLNVKEEYYEEALKIEIDNYNASLRQELPWDKLSLYIEDSAMDKLAILSNNGLDLGYERAMNGKIANRELVENYKQEMMALRKMVREFNRIRANTIYSDGILDYDYACGESEVFSLRLGHLLPRKNIEEEER